MKIIIATHNAHKTEEFKRILSPLGIDVISQTEAGIHLQAEEDADSFKGNSYLKAKAVYDAAKLPVIADDSGIAVDALGGAPGVYSARYGGEGLDDVGRCQKLLKELEGIPLEKRTARFVCAITLIVSDEQVISIEESCEGKIDFEPSGKGGFGYDPIFLYNKKSFGELSPAEKDEVSHRGKALRKLVQEIQNSKAFI